MREGGFRGLRTRFPRLRVRLVLRVQCCPLHLLTETWNNGHCATSICQWQRAHPISHEPVKPPPTVNSRYPTVTEISTVGYRQRQSASGGVSLRQGTCEQSPPRSRPSLERIRCSRRAPMTTDQNELAHSVDAATAHATVIGRYDSEWHAIYQFPIGTGTAQS